MLICDFCVHVCVAISILWRLFFCVSVCCSIYPVVIFVSLCVAVSILWWFLCLSVCCSICPVVIFVSVCMLQYLSSPYTAMAYQPPLHSGPLLHTMAAEVRTFLLSPPSFHTLMLGSPFNHSHKTSWWWSAAKTSACDVTIKHLIHTPSIAFRHPPPNSARFTYATEGALFISAQLAVQWCSQRLPKGSGTNRTVEAT